MKKYTNIQKKREKVGYKKHNRQTKTDTNMEGCAIKCVLVCSSMCMFASRPAFMQMWQCEFKQMMLFKMCCPIVGET